MYGASTLLEFVGEEPLTLAEAREHLRVDFATDDATITALISAARGYCESYIGFILRKQRRQTLFDCFGAFKIYGPAVSIESIAYLNTSGISTTIDAADYGFKGAKIAEVYPVDKWPEVEDLVAVTVTYTAGYEPEDVPKTIKQAILLTIGSWYESPADSVRRFPTASKAILDLHRVSIL